ncbi:MAG TPA: hypothetical protein PLF88_07830 [Opitutaceae bacterium]|nr:hypothetical protein [Opitutaceae bacterium]
MEAGHHVAPALGGALDACRGLRFVAAMKANWIERDGQVIDLPNLTAVVEKDGA